MSRRNKKHARRARILAASAPGFLQCAAGKQISWIAAEGGEGGEAKRLPSFEMTGYTGVPMKVSGFAHPVVIDLATLKPPSQSLPVPKSHNMDNLLGHTTSVQVSHEGITAKGVLSGDNEHTANVAKMAGNGFPWQASVGAEPGHVEFVGKGNSVTVNRRLWSGPLFVARNSTLREISILPMGADGATATAVAAILEGATKMTKFQAWCTARGIKCEELNEDQKKLMKQAYGSDDGDEEAKEEEVEGEFDDEDEEDEEEEEGETGGKKGKKTEAAAALGILGSVNAAETITAELTKSLRGTAAKEIKRQAAIREVCAGHEDLMLKIGKQEVNLLAHAIEQGWSADKTELNRMRNTRAHAPAIHCHGAPDISEAVFEAALLQATRHSFRLEDDSFYVDTSPDGKSSTRRVSERMQREVQGQLKTRYTDQVQQTAHTAFKGQLSLHQFFRAAHHQNRIAAEADLRTEHGWRTILAHWKAADDRMILGAGSSNLSVSNILANVLNKFALQGYLFTEQAWRDICAIRPVNDFKPTKSINLLGDVMFKQLGSTGQLLDASLGDQAFSNQAAPYGRILTIPWTHLVNDDLGMLTGAPMKIGQGAGLALNDYIWALWASLASGSVVGIIPAGTNLNGDDGVSFWRTSSSVSAAAKRAGTAYMPNQDSSAVLSATTLASGKKLFDGQIDPNGNPLGFDGMMPVLLFGPSNWSVAMSLLQAGTIVAAGLASTSAFSSSPDKNIWQGTYKPVMSRYIENANYVNSATAFWQLYNPMALPVLECCFLNGVDTPAVLQAGPDYQFDKLGISIRGTMPFGVNQQNFRGGVYNPG